tara:strand:+ start:6420 stop:6680 length:261 start_codon:yes stop_codon:yes gene_type:complete
VPIYTYKCETCREIFDVRHGMFFEGQRCVNPECRSEHVFRLPALADTNIKNKTFSKSKVGSVVDKYIKDAKEEIKTEKKKLKSEEM